MMKRLCCDTDEGDVHRGSCSNQNPFKVMPYTTDTEHIIDDLRERYPHGHPGFLPITVSELQLHSDKNHDYAKGGSALGNFDRVAAILALYPNLKLSDRRIVALVYAMKQLDAVLWGINSGIQHKVEGLKARLQDISVYSKIVMCMIDDEANQ